MLYLVMHKKTIKRIKRLCSQLMDWSRKILNGGKFNLVHKYTNNFLNIKQYAVFSVVFSVQCIVLLRSAKCNLYKIISNCMIGSKVIWSFIWPCKSWTTPVFVLHSLWRQKHMFLDILELRVESKTIIYKKNCLGNVASDLWKNGLNCS